MSVWKTTLKNVKAAPAAIRNAQKAAQEIKKLPSAEDVKLSDQTEINRVVKLVNSLSEHEISLLEKGAIDKLDALVAEIQRLALEAGRGGSPKTGDVGRLSLWMALLFVSGGIVTGVTIAEKKRSIK